MKYCFQCGRLTSGEPLFCNFCGRSYDVKLCHSRHVNPRSAEVCSQCGSRDLSTPQPKVSWWWKVVAFLVRAALALAALALVLALLIALLQGILSKPQMQNTVVGIAILVGLLFWMWREMPDWVKELARRFLKRKQRRDER
jgi:RNA polymerase subunit RPABC4/transcription elongation factor Spt4